MWVICCSAFTVGMSVPAMAFKATVQNTTLKTAHVSFQYVAMHTSTFTACQSREVTIVPQLSFCFDSEIFIGRPTGLMTISVSIDEQTFFKFADGSVGEIPQCLPSIGWWMDTSWKIQGISPPYSLNRIQ